MNAFSTMRLKSTKRTRLGTVALKVFPASNPSKSPSKGRWNWSGLTIMAVGTGLDRGVLLS